MTKLQGLKIDFRNFIFDTYGIDNIVREISNQMWSADYPPSQLHLLACRDIYNKHRELFESEDFGLTEEEKIDVLVSIRL